MYSLKEDSQKIYTAKTKFYWKTKYSTCVKVKLDAQCDLLIKAGTSYQKLYVKYEFNVGKLSDDGWQELLNLFEVTYNFGYQEAYQNLRVDYIELALDFKGIKFNSICAIDNKIKEFNDTYQDVGTLYYGSKTSNKVVAFYDKAKQLKEVEKVFLDDELLRVEFRLKKPKLRLKELIGIKNPFISFDVFDINKSHILDNRPTWVKFKKLVLEEGLHPQVAYLIFSADQREALTIPIKMCKYDWWDPKVAWELAKLRISDLAPK